MNICELTAGKTNTSYLGLKSLLLVKPSVKSCKNVKRLQELCVIDLSRGSGQLSKQPSKSCCQKVQKCSRQISLKLTGYNSPNNNFVPIATGSTLYVRILPVAI